MEFKTLEELFEYNRKVHEEIFGKVQIQQEKVFDKDGMSYFERITAISQPHKVFKLDWSSYGSLNFADTFLPDVNLYKSTAMWVYDGAELFANIRKSDRKTLSLSGDKDLINLLVYTYPKGVLAEKKKDTLVVAKHEICTFIEIDIDNSIDIHFKFGDDFKKFIRDYYDDIDQKISVSSIENKIYQTDKQEFQKRIGESFLHYDMMQYILETLNLKNLVKKYTISKAFFARKEKNIYKLIENIKLEEELYIVVKGYNVNDRKVFISILDKNNILDIETAKDSRKFVPVLVDNEQVIKIKGKFDKKDANDKTAKTYFTAIKIKLRAKKDKDLKKMYENLDKVKDDKAYLYLLVDFHSANKDVKEEDVAYYGKNEDDDDSIVNYWLDIEGKYLKVSFCNCGYQYINSFNVQKYGTDYGLVYLGTKKLAHFSGWNDLIKNKKLTQDEKEILIAMSENEGNLDSVQAYDNQIFTAGAMQKTVNIRGGGEFPIQVQEFKKDFPKKYKTLFEDCGWIVENNKMYYKNPIDEKAKKITGKDLKSKIREGCSKDTNKKKIRNAILEPIIRAILDKDFQDKQVIDFIVRLHKALNKKPDGHTAYKIEDFIKSKLGKATVLDHDVNRPNHVSKYFGKALDTFYSKKDKEIEDENKKIDKENETIPDPKLKNKKKEKISRNPKDWGDKHSEYEKEILDIYGPLRGDKSIGATMTDAANRYNKLKNKLQ